MGVTADIQAIKRAIARLEGQLKKGSTKSKVGDKLSRTQVRQRTGRILEDVRKHRTVNVNVLGNIAQRHGMARGATGALYAGGYVQKNKAGQISLTQKGRAFKP